MAKRDEQKANNGHDSGGIKVRVIEFELHGRNATVSEGIKAITAAISGRAVVVPEPKRPALPSIPNTTTTIVDAEEVEQPEETADIPDETDVVEQTEENANGNSSGSGRSDRTVTRPPSTWTIWIFLKPRCRLRILQKRKGTRRM